MVKKDNTLIEAHRELVESIAKGYQNRGLSLPELIEAGNKGLLEAADRLSPDKFDSFAAWWIRQTMLKAIAETEIHKTGKLK